MATNAPPTTQTSKLPSASSGNSLIAQQTSQYTSSEHSQRRVGGQGSFGAGSVARGQNAFRGKQARQHKQSRRYRYPDDDAIAETASQYKSEADWQAAMNSTRNRKGQTSITHLMNFSIPPIPSNPQQFQQRHGKRNPSWGLGSGYHAIDKARYVHANYRFVVDPRCDYNVQSLDADVYLDWANVQQIIVSPQAQASSCPICLGDPVAPRMAKCGHIFCLHCLIRYMHSTVETQPTHEKRPRWKRCPICDDSVYMSDVRAVRLFEGQEGPMPREHTDVVLRLIKRPAGSTLALPKESSTMVGEGQIPWHFAADAMDYARVMKATESYMHEQFELELTQIETLEKHDELMFGEGTEWTGKAKRNIQEAMERIKDLGDAPNPSQTDRKSTKRGQSSLESDHFPGNDLPSISERGATNNFSHQNSYTDYHFYQALLHYYLSPLDIRILKAAFNDYSAFPATVLARIEHISTGHIVDDELRRRTKYLAHLPRGCEVAFLECDWTDIVPEDVLARFKEEITKRRRRNEEKATKEEKERVRAEKIEEDKRYAMARRRRAPSPEWAIKMEDFEPLNNDQPGNDPSFGTSSELVSTSPMWRRHASNFETLASPGTSPTGPRTVWGTTAITPAVAFEPPEELELAADDGWLQGWERDLLAEDSLVNLVAQTSLEPDGSRNGNAGAKKKRGKKITLMSTTARRGA